MLLKTCLSAIPDHRRAQGRLDALESRWRFSIRAVLSDATADRTIQRFIQARLERLNKRCGRRWKRAPAHPARRDALKGLDPVKVEAAVRGHAAVRDGPGAGVAAIALEGKPVRGRCARCQAQRTRPVLSALATDSPWGLGHVLISTAETDNSHEMPAAPQLLEALGLSGRLFTVDARQAQHNR